MRKCNFKNAGLYWKGYFMSEEIKKTIKEAQLCVNCKHFDIKDKWASFTCLECSFYETNQQTNYESKTEKM